MYVANLSAYTFLIHQVVIAYYNAFCLYIIKNSNSLIKVVLTFIITIVCAEIYLNVSRYVKQLKKCNG